MAADVFPWYLLIHILLENFSYPIMIFINISLLSQVKRKIIIIIK